MGACLAAEVVVIGAGAAGCHAVRALAEAGFRGCVLLIDQTPQPAAGRVWGSWAPLGEGDLVAHGPHAQRVAVATSGGARLLPLVHHAYEVVRGADLEAATDEALREVGGERLTAHALGIVDEGASAVVSTSAGHVRARWVLDSVGLAHPAGLVGTAGVDAPTLDGARVVLDFVGWEVVAGRGVFDPGTVTLMDFRVPQGDEAVFGYVLPLSRDHAVVELSAFTGSASPPERTAALRSYADSVVGSSDYDVVRREAGRLPLRVAPRTRLRGRTLTVGTPGGLLKASTGYGFQFARRDAAAVAASLCTRGRPQGLPRRRRHRDMDTVFLELARRDPGSLVAALDLLFARNPADRVVRFLDERTTLREEVRLIASLPVAPFVRASLRFPPDRP